MAHSGVADKFLLEKVSTLESMQIIKIFSGPPCSLDISRQLWSANVDSGPFLQIALPQCLGRDIAAYVEAATSYTITVTSHAIVAATACEEMLISRIEVSSSHIVAATAYTEDATSHTSTVISHAVAVTAHMLSATAHIHSFEKKTKPFIYAITNIITVVHMHLYCLSPVITMLLLLV